MGKVFGKLSEQEAGIAEVGSCWCTISREQLCLIEEGPAHLRYSDYVFDSSFSESHSSSKHLTARKIMRRIFALHGRDVFDCNIFSVLAAQSRASIVGH